MQKRAATGGEIGLNGEFYEGGKFLPSTKQPKRRATRSSGTGRVLVAPGQLEVPPEGKHSIFVRIDVFVTVDAAGQVALHPRFDAEHPAVLAYSNGIDELRSLVERFNAGERWISAS